MGSGSARTRLFLEPQQFVNGPGKILLIPSADDRHKLLDAEDIYSIAGSLCRKSDHGVPNGRPFLALRGHLNRREVLRVEHDDDLSLSWLIVKVAG